MESAEMLGNAWLWFYQLDGKMIFFKNKQNKHWMFLEGQQKWSKRYGSNSSLDQSSTLTAGPMVQGDRCGLTGSIGLSKDACSSSNWPSSYWSKWFPAWVAHIAQVIVEISVDL